MESRKLILKGDEIKMKMSIKAFREIARFVLQTPFQPGQFFQIEGTDKKKLLILLED